ncbi:HD domain-containing protein [Orientia tsutsugamushi]|uniref:HD domain-containing protein n=1 Tax=Orientia tsutsugamushi TaxID=784 RepID=UPI00123AAE26|nr:HD domain-containing protein [Orientia tsutsugamushi]QES95843.1 bifunctional (p)ppGpp synthetase/guanosine-3',5'-bis(diphosphate) 3'-pyrophosphohydrolase [Orientia tsutsugamushi]
MFAFLNCEHINKLLDKLDLINHSFDKRINLDKVEKAIFYVKKYHGNQKRDIGEPYYMHPLEVARMVADYSFKTDTIITAILHDTIEDTTLTKEKIAIEFNDNIAEQVLALTRNRGGKKTSSIKMIKTLVNQDKVELLLIKLLDRLDNIKTIFIKPVKRRQEIILETQQEFIPLAEYLKLPEIAIKLNKYCELYAT